MLPNEAMSSKANRTGLAEYPPASGPSTGTELLVSAASVSERTYWPVDPALPLAADNGS